METASDDKNPNSIEVELSDGQVISAPRGVKVFEVLLSNAKERKLPVLGAKVNNEVRDLDFTLNKSCRLDFLDYRCEDGRRIYERSLIMVMARAASEVLPGCSVTVKHSLSNGIYGVIKLNRAFTENYINFIEERMREIVEADEPITKKRLVKEEAVNLFLALGQEEKVKLLKYHLYPEVDIYNCGWFHDFAYEPLAPRTGVLKAFRLRFYLPGFILELPKEDNPLAVPEYVEQGKLASIYFEVEKWRRALDVQNVVSLNWMIENGGAEELIRVGEAFHEKKTSQIADSITSNIDRIRLVTIAGPSSSGKSTFIRRLATQLKVNGIQPVFISLDNYFVNREKTPRNEKGEYDFESLDAIDKELFNEHLTKLFQGEEVELPYFNFKLGRRQYRGETLKLGENDLIMIEGIHGLNDKLTRSIPLFRKYKVYISALTYLNLDAYKRIPTTDVRLLRRIVRDNRCRGKNALETIRMWPSVRKGEERNIFPFQESADVMFNSAVAYELPVLKVYAEPLLEEITPDLPEYAEAVRLKKLLGYFLPLSDRTVPANSIIREFVGDSCYLD